MKIVHIIFSMQIGGAETMLVDIVNEQVKSDRVCLIVINNSCSELVLKEIDTNVQIFQLGRVPRSKSPIPLFKLNYLLWLQNPDIIHAHNPNVCDLLLPCISKRRLDVTLHCYGLPSKNMHKYRKIYGISDAVSLDMQIRSKRPITTIYNGVRTDKIKLATLKSIETIRLVQIGRLDISIKGQDLTLKAIAKLRSKGYNIEIDFYGEGVDLEQLQQCASELEISESVRFLGVKERNYIYQHLCDYHLLVQPSRDEGFGLTIAEGLSANLPVIISNLEGPMEVINNGEWGYFFQSDNQTEYTDKLEWVIENYESIFQLTCIRSENIRNKFSIQNTVKEYMANYSVESIKEPE